MYMQRIKSSTANLKNKIAKEREAQTESRNTSNFISISIYMRVCGCMYVEVSSVYLFIYLFIAPFLIIPLFKAEKSLD